MNPEILIVEDDPDGARSVSEAVADAGFSPIAVATAAEGEARFRRARPDVVLTDLVLPDFDGITLLAKLKKIAPNVPVLVMTAYGSVESSVKAMQAGAYDYIAKPLDLDEMQSKLRRAAEASRLRREVDALTRSIRQRDSAASMVAASDAMRAVIAQIEALADTNATVLVQGESGTGKELVARALHVDSRRSQGPFVAVNCGAFAESLLESELFGHEKGAFTGATQQHPGAFERADGGTLFLDEIGDAPPPVQVKLLRAIEEREIRRIGGREPFKVDVRIVSATHYNLAERIAEGLFREDLFYRINVVTIRLPPLRERIADIRPLADRFIAQACEQHGRKITGVAPDFYEKIERYDWPGNIRQLRNILESAVLLTPTPTLNAEAVSLPTDAAPAIPSSGTEGFSKSLDTMTLEDVEREVLTQALRRNQGNRTVTAEKLGISRRTIQRKIKEHGLPF